MKRLMMLTVVIFLTACRQEISTDLTTPVVTSVLATNTPAQTAPAPATSTPAFPPPQPLLSGAISIITIGDDFTRGDGDDIGRGYPGRLLELVSQIRPGSTITNFAQSGWTSDNLIHGDDEFSGQLVRAEDEVRFAVSQGRAAIVLVWIGGNDLWELYTGKAKLTSEQEEQDLQRFETNVNMILFNLRSAGAEVVIAKLDDQSKRPAVNRSKTYPDITDEELERMSLQIQRYNEVITVEAEKTNALTVDFYTTSIFTNKNTLSADGFHPNPAGYDLITQTWYKALIEILP